MWRGFNVDTRRRIRKVWKTVARAPSDMHDRVPVSSVGGTRAHSDVCDRLAIFLLKFQLRCPVRSEFRRISPSHLVGLVEKTHIPRNKCPSRSL